MRVQLGAKPEHDFTDPLGLLSDCHRRIEKFLAILLRVTDECGGRELGREHREAMEAALNYFQKALPRHTQDEEESLFPRLRAGEETRASAALEKVTALEADHAAADRAHQRVDELGRKWLTQGQLGASHLDELRVLLAGLQEMYAAHIRLEDTELFPAARATLDAMQIREIGREMAKRRAIQLPECEINSPAVILTKAKPRTTD